MGKGNSHTPSIFAAIGLYHEAQQKAHLNRISPNDLPWRFCNGYEKVDATLTGALPKA
jgi:hypothetical protein